MGRKRRRKQHEFRSSPNSPISPSAHANSTSSTLSTPKLCTCTKFNPHASNSSFHSLSVRSWPVLSAIIHRPNDRLEEIGARFRDYEIVDQDARVAAFEGRSGVAQEFEAGAVGAAVEDGAEEVVARVCDGEKI